MMGISIRCDYGHPSHLRQIDIPMAQLELLYSYACVKVNKIVLINNNSKFYEFKNELKWNKNRY